MDSIFSRYKNALVLMLVLLAQIVLLAMQVRRPAPGLPDGHNVRLWRAWVATIVTPPERLVNRISQGTGGLWSNYIYLRHLKQQNEGLRDENNRLRLEQSSLAEDAREGQELRRMLDFKGQYLEKTLPAQVIGTSGTDQARIIYIDKGSSDGLKLYMPVITPDGIVGKLKNVFANTSQVLLISDQTSGTGVILQSTRIRGVMKGNASGQPQIVSVSPDERIKAGELVMTSGGDQIYPPGMPVGEVDRVVADHESSFLNIVVNPAAHLSRLQAVLVVTSIADKMPFSQEKDLMQSEVDGLAVSQRAADVLSEKLPSLHDEDVEAKAPTGDAEGATTSSAEDPARPLRPPSAIHPDRYTPGAAPSAESLTPGQAPPMTHKAPTFDANQFAPAPHVTKPAANPANTTVTTAATGSTASSPHPGLAKTPGIAPWPSLAKPAANANPTASAKSASSDGTSTTAATSSSKPTTKTTTVTEGSGFKLPLQPADMNARRTATPVTGDSSASQTLPRTLRPSSVTGGISSDGILEPAGMGQIGNPRSRLTTPKPPAATDSAASGNGSATPSATGASATPKPATPKSVKPSGAPAQKPQTAPSQPTHSAPPGGR
jgi:rod shape-determining protein MreC